MLTHAGCGWGDPTEQSCSWCQGRRAGWFEPASLYIKSHAGFWRMAITAGRQAGTHEIGELGRGGRWRVHTPEPDLSNATSEDACNVAMDLSVSHSAAKPFAQNNPPWLVST